MLPNIGELLYQDLSHDLADLRKTVQQILTRVERSEVAGGLANSTLANLPSVNNTGGDLYFASDGLKPGEAPGHGTGTSVFWDASTNAWLRVGDYQPPSGGGGPLSLALGGTGAALNGAGGTSFYVKLGLGATAMSVGLIADGDLPVVLSGHTISGGSINSGTIIGNPIVARGDSAATIPSQLEVQGASNNNQQTLVGYNTTSDYGSIQALVQGVGVKPLTLQLLGGQVGIGVIPAHTLDVNGDAGIGTSDQTIFNNAGKVTKYNNDTTAANGLASNVGNATQINQTLSIGATTLFTAPVAGEYIIMLRLLCTTGGTGGTVSASINWTDEVGASASNTSNLSLSVTGETSLLLAIHSTAAIITYSTTVSGGTGAFKYAVFVNVLRLS